MSRFSIQRSFKHWARLSWSQRFMLFECTLRTTRNWFVIRALSYRQWSGRLGQRVDFDTQAAVAYTSADPHIKDIAWCLRAIQNASGNRFTCLMLALTASEMLKSRGIESRLVLGVERSPHSTRNEPFRAHAWVIANGITVVGGEGNHSFTPVAVYRAYDNENNVRTESQTR